MKGQELTADAATGIRHSNALWLPSRRENRQRSTNEEEQKTKILMNSVRSIMNKLTPCNFHSLVYQFKTLPVDDDSKFIEVVDLIIEAAVNDRVRCNWYVYFIASIDDEVLSKRSFRMAFIERSMILFEDLPELGILTEKEEELKNCMDRTKKAEVSVLLEECKYRSKIKALGICQVVGELFKLDLLSKDDLNRCIEQLLSSQPIELNLECLHKLLTTIGSHINNLLDERTIEKYFYIIEELRKNESNSLSVRITFFMFDLLECRKNQWIPRHKMIAWKNIQLLFADPFTPSKFTVHKCPPGEEYGSVSLTEIEQVEKILCQFENQKRLIDIIDLYIKQDSCQKIKLMNTMFLCVLLRSTSAECCGRLILMLVLTGTVARETVLIGFSKTIETYKNYACFPELIPPCELMHVLKILVMNDIIDPDREFHTEFFIKSEAKKMQSKRYRKFNRSSVRVKSSNAKIPNGQVCKSSSSASNQTVPQRRDASIDNEIQIFVYENQPGNHFEVSFKRLTNNETKNDEILREMKTSLDKVTANVIYKPLRDKLKGATSTSHIEQIIDFVFNEITENPCLCPWYVDFCKVMKNTVVFCPKTLRGKQFQSILLAKCQQFLTTAKKDDFAEKWKEIDACFDIEKEFHKKMRLVEMIGSAKCKLIGGCKFIFEILASHQTTENEMFLTVLKNSCERLIDAEYDCRISQLCEFFHLLGGTAVTSAVLECLHNILINFRCKILLSATGQSATAQKLLDETLNFLETRINPRRLRQKFASQVIQQSEIILVEHFYMDDVVGCILTLVRYFDRDEMTVAIGGIFNNVICVNHHPSVIEFCGKLIIGLLADEKISFVNIIDAVLSLYNESDENRLSNLSRVLVPVISQQPALFDQLRKAFEKNLSTYNATFFESIKSSD